jgi:hypothetical protein
MGLYAKWSVEEKEGKMECPQGLESRHEIIKKCSSAMSLHWESFNRPSDFTIDSISVIGIYQGPGSCRGMRKFKLTQQTQRFLGAHAAVYNSFNLGRHLVSAENYRYFRSRAFASWNCTRAL